MTPSLVWDSIARKYVQRTDRQELAVQTFGDLPATVAAKWPGGCTHCGHGARSCVCPGPPANDNRARKGDWLQTFSGRQFWPMDPRADEVFIEDIAHALAMQCRYAGHCIQFYSVAEHSVHLAQYFMDRGASLTICRWALMHDASEAYLVDVPRPVKPFLAGYKPAEAAVMRAICERFGMPYEMPAVVHEADGRIIADERHNMRPCAAEWAPTGEALGIRLQYWSPDVADIYFMHAFKKLFSENMEVAA